MIKSVQECSEWLKYQLRMLIKCSERAQNMFRTHLWRHTTCLQDNFGDDQGGEIRISPLSYWPADSSFKALVPGHSKSLRLFFWDWSKKSVTERPPESICITYTNSETNNFSFDFFSISKNLVSNFHQLFFGRGWGGFTQTPPPDLESPWTRALKAAIHLQKLCFFWLKKHQRIRLAKPL